VSDSSPASPPASTPPPAPPAALAEPPVGGPGATWGPGRVVVGILALLVGSALEVGFVMAFDPDLSTVAGKVAAQAMLALTLVGIALAVTSGPEVAGARGAALGLRRPQRSPFKLAGGVLAAYIVFAITYANLVQPHQKDIPRDLGFGHGTAGVIAAILLIAVLAPISEEIFFRGFVFGGMRRRLSFVPAALISGVIFGIFHFTGASSATVVPLLAVLGFALCFVYEETGSIYPTIAIHAINNGIVLLSVALA
jgi:membrane protease YdiL (CAAX protease family)